LSPLDSPPGKAGAFRVRFDLLGRNRSFGKQVGQKLLGAVQSAPLFRIFLRGHCLVGGYGNSFVLPAYAGSLDTSKQGDGLNGESQAAFIVADVVLDGEKEPAVLIPFVQCYQECRPRRSDKGKAAGYAQEGLSAPPLTEVRDADNRSTVTSGKLPQR
jgi:hypothetical protein